MLCLLFTSVSMAHFMPINNRKTTRYEQIKVSWVDEQNKPKIKTFKGFTAQIIQHEIDHCNGILI